MMKKVFFLLLSTALLSAACGPAARVLSSADNYPPLPEYVNVFVLDLSEQAPADGAFVGVLEVGDSGFSMDCDYQTVILKAKEQARTMGGNLVKITDHKKPNFFSTCHRIRANVYLMQEDSPYMPTHQVTIDQALLEEDCAILYFYRERNSAGSLVGYNVWIGDDVVWRASNNRKEWVKVKAVGMTMIRAKTESERKLEIDIQPGRHYYIRCGVGMGVMVGRPSLELVDERTGKFEFDQIQK